MSDTIETIAQGDAQERAYLAAISYAKDLGSRHGRNAASWVEIPDAATARAILTGLGDGDPAILDTLPAPDLSGQWAGEMTGPELVKDACDAAGIPEDAEEPFGWFTDICDAYELAFDNAVEDEVSRRARYMAD